MGKFCPTVKHKVPYLTCMECEERVCESKNAPQINILPKKENAAQTPPRPQEEAHIKNEKHATLCDRCCHNFNQTGNDDSCQIYDVQCEIHRRLLINKSIVNEKGCEYYNVDMSNQKICMNCKHFLGGGDWGMACAKHYHKLPNPLTVACEDFTT